MSFGLVQGFCLWFVSCVFSSVVFVLLFFFCVLLGNGSMCVTKECECGCESVLMLWLGHRSRVCVTRCYSSRLNPRHVCSVEVVWLNITTTITLTMTSTEQEHEHKQQRTARAGALMAHHPAWVDHHTGGSRSTPTVHCRPIRKAVGGSTTTNPQQQHTTMTCGEPRQMKFQLYALRLFRTRCSLFCDCCGLT